METSENASFSMETPKTESFENATTTIYTTSSVSKRVRTKEMKTNENGVMETPPFSYQALFLRSWRKRSNGNASRSSENGAI